MDKLERNRSLDQQAENPEVTHLQAIYRDLHQRFEKTQLRAGVLVEGIEAVLTLIGRDEQDEKLRAVYTLLQNTIDAGHARVNL
jgi:hypothetical protein